MNLVRSSQFGLIKNARFLGLDTLPLAISAIGAEAVGSDTGRINITVNKGCTFRFRFKSSGPVTTRGVTPAGDFPPTFIFTVEQAGTYSFLDNSNQGGSLSPDTGYYIGAYAWIGDEGSPDEETAIEGGSGIAFTTDAEGTLAAPTIITPTAISVSEATQVGATIGFLSANGNPAPTFSEVSDPDGKFTVAPDGRLTLAAALDFTSSTSHTALVRATNSQGSSDQNVTLNVLENTGGGGGGIGATDYTVPDIAAFYSLVDSWPSSGGIIQVPGSAPKVILISATNTSGLNSARRFSHQVTIRGQGLCADGWNAGSQKPAITAPLNITNVNLNGFENFRIYLAKLPPLLIGDTKDLTLERCAIWGQEFNGNTHPDNAIGTSNVVQLADTPAPNTRLTLKDCYIAFAKTSFVYVGSNQQNPVIDGCVFEMNRHDNLKAPGANIQNMILRNLWGSRNLVRIGSGVNASHVDWLQTQRGTSTGTVIEYCCHMSGTMLNAAQGGGTAEAQGIFMASTGFATNLDVRQIIMSSGSKPWHHQNTGFGFIRARYSDSAHPGDSGLNTQISAGFSNDFNIFSWKGTGDGDNGAGPNGLAVDVGQFRDGDLDLNAYTRENIYSGIPRPSTGFEVYMPVGPAYRPHWDHGNPVGAYDFKRRVFVEGLHPGNIGWPIAGPWSRMYNFNGVIASAHGGNYDSNGNNV